METIDYAETTAEAALKEIRISYDTMHDRVYKFATLAMGASGAVGIYALGKIGAPGHLWQIIPMACLAAWWLVVASILLIKGAATDEFPGGTTSAKIRERVEKHSKTGEGGVDLAHGLNLTRWDQVSAVDLQIEAFSKANLKRARVLDGAYKWMVASPLAALAGLLLACCIQR